MLDNVETMGVFVTASRQDYAAIGYEDEDVDQIMKSCMHTGANSHKEYHPVLNFVSGVLDVTIIKPLIESIVGQDLITGEKLTDFERGMQFIDAFLGIITLGQSFHVKCKRKINKI